MFRFCFGRSSCVSGISLSSDGKSYIIYSRKWRVIEVPIEELKVEIHKKLGKFEGTVLTDTGSNVRSKKFSGPTIITARNEFLIMKFFEENNVPYPGVSKKEKKDSIFPIITITEENRRIQKKKAELYEKHNLGGI